MKISVATASIAFEERGQETTCDFFGAEGQARDRGRGIPLCQQREGHPRRGRKGDI